jgi:hypothetical protein
MPLSINPLSQLVSSISSSISKATNESNAALANAGDAFAKADLQAKIDQASGAIGSGLNGLTGQATGFANSLQNGAASLVAGAGTALGGIGNPVQSAVGSIGSLQSVAGSISNVTADITGSLNKLAGGNLASGLMGIAGAISSAAGVLNNLLSLKRGANIPAGAELFMQQGSAIELKSNSANDWRVRINAQWKNFNSPLFKVLESTGGVVWPYTPNITVSTKAEYTSINPLHGNYAFQAYKNSVVDDITISGEFSCETQKDALYWIAATTFFKTATKMFFGTGSLAGNPPIVCNLSGYGSSIFDKVPVVIKSFSVDLKDDVNYVKCTWPSTASPTWVPAMSTVTVVVAPVYNRRRLRQFSLEDYAKGQAAKGVGYI